MANAAKGSQHRGLSLDYKSIMCLGGLFTTVATFLNVVLADGNQFLSVNDNVVLKVFLLAAMAVVFVGFFFLSDRLASDAGERATMALSVVGLCAWVLSILMPSGNVYVHAAYMFVTAAGMAALLETWFVAICVDVGVKSRQSFIAAGMAASFALCLVGCFIVNPLVQKVVAAVLWVLSFGFFLLLQRAGRGVDALPSVVDAKDSDSRSKIPRESAIMLVVIYVQIGFLFGQVMALPEAAPWVIGVALFTGGVMAIDGLSGKPVISEASIYPLTVPLTVCALVCLYLFNPVVHIVALCALAIISTLYLITGWVALVNHVLLSRLSPIRVFSRARMGEFFGVAGGFAVGVAAQMAYGADTFAALRVTIVAAVLYAFIASFFHKSRFPDTTIGDGVEKMTRSPEKGLWKRRCNAVGERYGLSERQREVLALIGQGRNAEYVAKSLVISVSTVQTHIRNIYQKLGVHSRQELLDLIENTKLYGED